MEPRPRVPEPPQRTPQRSLPGLPGRRIEPVGGSLATQAGQALPGQARNLLPDPRNLPLPLAPAPPLDVAGYERLTRDVRSLLGIDLAQYKPAQVWRRVNGFASARGVVDADGLVARARTDPVLRQAFLDMLTINVSEFFRNPEAWSTFGATYLGSIMRRGTPARIWSAGCSLGYEPYTLAILARELVPAAGLRILATDLDETTLAKARLSRYTDAQLMGVSPARRSRWFRQDGEVWEVKPELRALVTFRRHDLLRDPYESGFDAIVCRNVVIYFPDAAKDELYRRFAAALKPGGVLFVGATESIPDSRRLGLEPAGTSFYVRPG